MMNRLCLVPVLAFACAALPCRPAAAQAAGESQPPGAIVLGPLSVTPTLTLKDAGIDNNVFNEDVNPKTDVTFTLTPAANIGFRVRRLRTTCSIATDYVYYRKYATERGTNFGSEARADLDLGVFQPYVSIGAVSTRNRLNAEVDTRGRHRDVTFGGGTSVRVSPTTRFTFSGRRGTVAFDPSAEFRGVPLDQSFDGSRVSLDGGLTLELTPVTSVNLVASHETQTFDLSPDRNSTSWRIGPSLAFDPLGLITGSASIGYRRFTTVSSSLPSFSGLVASVSLGATIYGRHQMQTVLLRDVQYSYDPVTPYYLGTGASVTWTSLVAGPIDLRGTAGRQHMGYRSVVADVGEDSSITVGGGIGYRFSDRARLGINAERSQRNSTRSALREYRNHRVFASLTWGIVP